jgi:release factor glutamine methyltransferase
MARANADRFEVGARALFSRSDWFEGADGLFDLIVSNPPYIAVDEIPGLEPEVRDWEPRMALTDEGDGLGAYRAIVAGARKHLEPGGRILLEHGPTQAAAIAAIGRSHGLPEPEHRRDLDGRMRAVLFRAP